MVSMDLEVSLEHTRLQFHESHSKQECIPVGCVPPARSSRIYSGVGGEVNNLSFLGSGDPVQGVGWSCSGRGGWGGSVQGEGGCPPPRAVINFSNE